MNAQGNSDKDPAKTLDNLGASAGAAGALAAGLLAGACRQAPEGANGLQIKVVRDLAGDLERQLEALAQIAPGPPVDALADGALCCADLASLAACALPELPEESFPQAAAAVHLATGAAKALGVGIEAGARGISGTSAENTLRDARGALWRAGLATRQAEAAAGGGSGG